MVLTALAPLGECWQLRYLRQFPVLPVINRQCFGVMWKICRILSETSPDATDMARLIQLTVPFRKSFQLLPGPSHIHGREKWFLPTVVKPCKFSHFSHP